MLISPYKGNLAVLEPDSNELPKLITYGSSLPSVRLSQRELCDLEMLATGAFSPLRTFVNSADYKRVLETMRLNDETLFPIPITLSVAELSAIDLGRDIALRGPKNDLLAIMRVTDIYEPDHIEFAESVLGTADPRHPMVVEMCSSGRFNLSGELRMIQLPDHHDIRELRLTPRQTRERLDSMGRPNVVAFQTRNPLHRGHEEITRRAMEMVNGTLLLHPTVGMTKPGDIDHITRVRTYKAVAQLGYPKNKVLLSVVPLAMRMAGPREALLHAIIRRNYGANSFIVGRDHASPGTNTLGKPFYEPFAAQNLALKHGPEIGVEILKFPELRYSPKDGKWIGAHERHTANGSMTISGTSIRNDFLAKGKEIPQWAVRPEVAKILSEAYKPRSKQGLCVWFTGLSGAGKSTTADILTALLLEEGRQVSLLDGDVVRTHLSKGLGFSREDRDSNVTRIGFVASEIVRHGGVAICAAISPYRESRNKVRSMFEPGSFIEVFVNTPLDVCETRDPKGMYAKARRGEITNLTGADDIYEDPQAPEIVLGTVDQPARENADRIVKYLRSEGFLVQEAKSATEVDRIGERRWKV